MNNEPSIKQKAALKLLYDDKTNFVGYGGAAYGGKSYLMCYWLTVMALYYKETSYGLCRKELNKLKKTTLLTLFKVFGEMGIKNGTHYNYNQQLNTITFKNNSVIFLIDTAYKPSDPLYGELGGYELTCCAIDESQESPAEAINILFTRVGRKNNFKYNITPKILETFNPLKNHVYNRYYKPHKNGTLKPTMAFIKALPSDNPSPDVESYVNGILANGDRPTIERLIHGNFDYDDDPNQIIEYECSVNMFTNKQVAHQPDGKPIVARKYITGDIAFYGSDMFVVFVWLGWVVIDCVVLAKSDGKVIEETFKTLCIKHQIPQSHVVYDADGVGMFLKGYLHNAVSFNNGGKPIEEAGQAMQYENLKAQCYFKLAEKINSNLVYITPEVANLKINSKFVREHITEEVPAIKKDNTAVSNKLKLINKKQMKELIGHSPDFMDALMMRAIFDLKQVSFKAPKMHIFNSGR